MLRTYFVQQWFNLSDPGVEEALYESPVLQRFVGVDLGAAPAPQGHCGGAARSRSRVTRKNSRPIFASVAITGEAR